MLDNLDRQALVTLLDGLLSRHPELLSEVQSLCPKLTTQTALTGISRLETAFHASFPYGGDKSGEYAYSRIHASYTALLTGIQDYVAHFLPPTTVAPAELLAFLDSVTAILHRIPPFRNPIHNIARETAFANLASAWEVCVRYFLDTQGSFSFVQGGWVQRIEGHAQKEDVLSRIIESVQSEISWAKGNSS
jgi:protein Cut8